MSRERKNWPDLAGCIRALRPIFAVMAGLAAVCVLQEGTLQGSPQEPPEGSVARREQDRGDEDAGTSGLGSDALTARVEQEMPEASWEEIGVEMPKKPLPGQARPPCKRREIEINDGCWSERTAAPPCGEREYEWQGLCYVPVLARPPPATSKQR